jgi:PAS domain S-box-containing protein
MLRREPCASAKFLHRRLRRRSGRDEAAEALVTMDGTPETRFAEMQRYVRFGPTDAALLGEFGALAAAEFPRIAREFYERIREHEDAHAVLVDEAQVQRLQRSLVAWLARACGGTYDEAYFAETEKIGRVHVRIGLSQRFMFTAMALIRLELIRVCDRLMGERSERTRNAINRILDLDLGIMLEAYHAAFVDRIHRVERAADAPPTSSAVARSERRYANAVDLAPVMIVGLDSAGTIRFFNREAERVTGFSRDEARGESFVKLLVAEDLRERHAALLTQVLDAKLESGAIESVLPARAGKLRDVVWHFAPPESRDDEEVAVFAMGSDVTDAKAMEERTLQVEKLAAVGTLAAGLAHEIRNPLNGAQLHISFLVRAIKKRGNDPEMREAAQVVAEEIKRLANLVTDFLDFARPKPLEVSTVSLVSLCERARSLVSPLAEPHDIAVTCDLPSTDVELTADAGKLEQVLLNLLRNAIEALAPEAASTSPSYGDARRARGHVVLRVRRQPRQAVIEVEDDGPGLKDDAPIFDAFYSTKEGGTGLGLAITHRIVTDHHGNIDATTANGKTTFRVTLPLAQNIGANK